jgi:hypothetical protein
MEPREKSILTSALNRASLVTRLLEGRPVDLMVIGERIGAMMLVVRVAARVVGQVGAVHAEARNDRRKMGVAGEFGAEVGSARNKYRRLRYDAVVSRSLIVRIINNHTAPPPSRCHRK